MSFTLTLPSYKGSLRAGTGWSATEVRILVRWWTLRVAIVVVWPMIDGWVKADTVACATCHGRQATDLSASVHKSLACRECHGGEASYTMDPKEAATFIDRVDGASLIFDHGASFSGKPARRLIPQLCGDCHANVEKMNRFGLRVDQLARYWTSEHGKALGSKGDERVAVCTDCHGVHDVATAREPTSRTHPLNVPGTCATCHADAELMGRYGIPAEIVDEYRSSVHGRLLLEDRDTGAPTCATCHGNHSAAPPGFADVGAVCGQCHQDAAASFAKNVHSGRPGHRGCVQCHGGGEGRHWHLIERVTSPPDVMIERYARLLASEPDAGPDKIAAVIHPAPAKMMERNWPTCTECHDDPETDQSQAKIGEMLGLLSGAELYYVQTARRLDEVGRGVLLVDRQRFVFEGARTQLIALGSVQHTFDMGAVRDGVTQLHTACDQVRGELDELEEGLSWRRRALIPVWIFSLVFAGAIYVKYKQVKAIFVKPLPSGSDGR